jgi:hypothetical protein
MKNIKADPEDTLRSEYKRSDFGELVRGKYATTQVDFQQLTEALLTCIAEDDGVKFEHHSIGNYLARQTLGDWTYEIDNANQITLRYWLREFGSIEVAISNPPNVVTPEDRADLQGALLEGVTTLKTKMAEHEDRK